MIDFKGGDCMSILKDSLMDALDKLIPQQSYALTDGVIYASGCGCSGSCGQSCSGGCEVGCTGNCGRSCYGSCS